MKKKDNFWVNAQNTVMLYSGCSLLFIGGVLVVLLLTFLINFNTQNTQLSDSYFYFLRSELLFCLSWCIPLVLLMVSSAYIGSRTGRNRILPGLP